MGYGVSVLEPTPNVILLLLNEVIILYHKMGYMLLSYIYVSWQSGLDRLASMVKQYFYKKNTKTTKKDFEIQSSICIIVSWFLCDGVTFSIHY